MAARGGEDGTAVDETPDEDTEELLEEVERRRSLRGPAAVVVSAIAVAFSAFQMWVSARGYIFEATLPLVGTYRVAALQQLQVNTIHVTFALLLAFLMYPASSGDGPLARRLGRLVPALRGRLGSDSAVTRLADRVRSGLRWAVVDRTRDRVTPADVTLALLALLPPLYTVTQFDEIRHMRVRGLGAGRPLGEVYPLLDPLAVGPLGDQSWAFLLGALGVLLVLEATRRALGLLLMTLVSLFIVYARLGYLIPRDLPGIGVFAITRTPWTSIVRDLWYNTEAGIFGIPVTVSVRFIYIFILFGAFLEMSGAGRWFIDLAYSITGTRRGGPAKASVVSSGFMGMLSGSSVANTVTTGAFTIPLMKRSGYTSAFAGAVEASVSSGGQILPPVMGAAAFLIVELTGTPYRVVIVAAALPAIAFFFGMWVMVHFEATRRGVGGLDRSELLDVRPHLYRGWFYLVPIVLLLYLLVVARLSINRAGWFTIVATVALIALVAAYDERTRLPLLGALLALTLASIATQSLAGTSLSGFLLGARDAGRPFVDAASAAVGGLAVPVIGVAVVAMLLRPRAASPFLDLDPAVGTAADRIDEVVGRELATTRPGRFGTFVLKSMEAGARTAVVVVVAVAAAGVIPGVISVSGLGPNLTRLVILASAESFLLLLVLAGISAIILGMGMPTTVMYIILVSVLGGALEQFGVVLLAAHLFVLYFGLMADVTPPVMVAAYAAAGVAKADAFETGRLAFLLSLNKIMVPFAFVLTPGILLLRGDVVTGEATLIGWADVADVGYFVPEVAVPVVGMFVGVYALSVTIIGFQYTEVSRAGRVLFAVASILVMVPGLLSIPFDTLFGVFGETAGVSRGTVDLLLRGVGALLLTVLVRENRRRSREEGAIAPVGTDSETAAPGT